jgi:hypothetical protein
LPSRVRPYIDRALELARCLLGIGHRQRSKARETVGMRVDGLVELLIGVARYRVAISLPKPCGPGAPKDSTCTSIDTISSVVR